MAETVAQETKKGGLPQLDPGMFVPQMVWLVPLFLVFYLIMSRVVLPRSRKVFKKRWDQVEGTLEKAQRLQEEAAVLKAEAEELLSQAREKADEMYRKASDEIAAEIAAKNTEMGANIANRMRDADAKIEASKDEVLKELDVLVIESAQAMVAKLTGEEMSDEAFKEALKLEKREVA